MNINIGSSSQEQAPYIQNDDAILFSPYYLRESHVLADQKSQVELGGFYMMDDSGGVISQLVNNQSQNLIVQGQIELGKSDPDYGGTVTIFGGDTSQSITPINAVSHKFLTSSTIKRESDYVVLTNNITIKNLTRLKNDSIELMAPEKEKALKVIDSTTTPPKSFYVYNIANKNSQLVVVHSIKPFLQSSTPDGDNNIPGTQTEINGLVYVDIDDNAYIGVMEPATLFIQDPNGIFRTGDNNVTPTA